MKKRLRKKFNKDYLYKCSMRYPEITEPHNLTKIILHHHFQSHKKFIYHAAYERIFKTITEKEFVKLRTLDLMLLGQENGQEN